MNAVAVHKGSSPFKREARRGMGVLSLRRALNTVRPCEFPQPPSIRLAVRPKNFSLRNEYDKGIIAQNWSFEHHGGFVTRPSRVDISHKPAEIFPSLKNCKIMAYSTSKIRL
jgi:hypothetical protein